MAMQQQQRALMPCTRLVATVKAIGSAHMSSLIETALLLLLQREKRNACHHYVEQG
jgi:hypothetical protein